MEELFRRIEDDVFALDAGHFIRKAQEQKDLVESGRDLQVLRMAVVAFASLQHVQILRLQDEPDRLLWEYLREHSHFASQFVELKWMPACVHGTKTIGEALLEGHSPFTRFSGPMMNPQSVLILQENPPHKVSSLASRLTCLELHFDEALDLDNRMHRLSPLFKNVFGAATGMLAVHIGFPSRAPLSLRLEEIFHHIRWDRLRAFGIQAWRLEADEIIALARRHRKSLRGLRLRDVLLTGSSMWKSVLGMLRDEMELLDWVSLRRIGYARSFDDQFAGTMEVPPDPPDGNSDSDIEDGFPTHLNANDDHHAGSEPDDDPVQSVTESEDDGADEDDDEDEDEDEDEEDDDHGPQANELSMDPDTPSSAPWCNCGRGSYPETADELGDNGQWVAVTQRKMWEKWVVGRCAEHT